MTIQALIETLNTLTTGELGQLRARVAEARAEAAAMGLADVAGALDEALAALAAFDLKTFRKRVNHAVARLGHARETAPSA